MKRKLFLTLALLLGFLVPQRALSQFTSVSPSGHTLYYSFFENENRATVICPYYDEWNGIFYGNYEKPSGNLIIPSTVTREGHTYTVTDIGRYAFSDCYGLTGITLPNTIVTIGYSAFGGCSGLTSITIPNSVRSIGDQAFQHCTGLTSITIPNSVIHMGAWVFYACTGLTSANINGYHSGGYLPEFTFQDCTSLTQVTIGSSITKIWMGAFHRCVNLTSIIIPTSVDTIHNEAFRECSSLTRIRMLSCTPPEIYALSPHRPQPLFDNTPYNLVVEIPCGSLAAYQQAWGTDFNFEESANISVDDIQNVCDSYTWPLNGVTYTSTPSNMPSVTLTATNGCDSVVSLQLTVNHSQHSHEYVTHCKSYTWAANGRTYNQSGVKTFKGTTPGGCISRDTLSLTIFKGYSNHEYVTHCGPFTWDVNGRTYNKSGAKYFKGTSEDGCPKYDTLTLTVVDRWVSHEQVTSCGPYTWDVTGKTYNKSGIKTFKSVSNDGCPVYDTLSLTVASDRHSHTYVSHCGPYTWDVNGRTYNKSGIKYNKGTTEAGCPAHDTLTLTVIDKYSNHEYVTNCGPYTWEVTGKTYNKSGVKTYKSIAEDGCPIYDTLTLVVNPISTGDTFAIADGSFTWYGIIFTSSYEPMRLMTNSYGCDSIVTLHLTITNKGGDNPATSSETKSNLSPLTPNLTLYPNPTTGLVHIDASQVDRVEVLDLVGRRVAVFENTATLNLSGLADGTYTLRIMIPEGVVLRKVVKR